MTLKQANKGMEVSSGQLESFMHTHNWIYGKKRFDPGSSSGVYRWYHAGRLKQPGTIKQAIELDQQASKALYLAEEDRPMGLTE